MIVLVRAFPSTLSLGKKRNSECCSPLKKMDDTVSHSIEEKCQLSWMSATRRTLVLDILSTFFLFNPCNTYMRKIYLFLFHRWWNRDTDMLSSSSHSTTSCCVTSSGRQTIYIKLKKVAVTALRTYIWSCFGRWLQKSYVNEKVATFSSSELSKVTGQPHCPKPRAEAERGTGVGSDNCIWVLVSHVTLG